MVCLYFVLATDFGTQWPLHSKPKANTVITLPKGLEYVMLWVQCNVKVYYQHLFNLFSLIFCAVVVIVVVVVK